MTLYKTKRKQKETSEDSKCVHDEKRVYKQNYNKNLRLITQTKNLCAISRTNQICI